MSRLIWWISVIILALLNGVRPIILADTPLLIDGYYMSTRGSPDPAAIYASFFPIDYGERNPCSTAPRRPTEYELTRYDKELKVQWINGNKAYVLATENGDYSGEIVDQEEEETLIPIIAPFPCKILTDPKGSDYSREMIVQDAINSHITLHITGMTKWYCCATHTFNTNGFYQHVGVDKNSYSQTVQTGFILGYANSKTRFCFFRDGDKITFDEYYYGADKEGKALGSTFKECIIDMANDELQNKLAEEKQSEKEEKTTTTER